VNRILWAFFALCIAVLALCVGEMEGAEAKLYVQLGHSSFVTSVAFSPDGRWALTGSHDGTARVWEVATGREIHRLEGDSAGSAHPRLERVTPSPKEYVRYLKAQFGMSCISE